MASTEDELPAVPSARIEVLAYAPTEFFHCQHCEVVWDHLGIGRRIHAEQRQSLLPPELLREYEQIGAWVHQVLARYGDRVRISIVDAASLEGVYKALRYRSRRFPAFIIDGRERVVGFDRERLEALLEQRLGPAPARKEV